MLSDIHALLRQDFLSFVLKVFATLNPGTDYLHNWHIEAIVALGLPPETAADHAKRFRAHDEKLLRAQHLVYDDDAAVLQTARDARLDLEKLFEADVSDSDGASDADNTNKP